jgi:hypothetical protein
MLRSLVTMPPDLPRLLRWAREPEIAARAESAARLRDHLDSPDAVTALTALIQDVASEVVEHAAASLGSLACPSAEAWRAISAGLHAAPGPVRDACGRVLAAWGYAAVGLDQFIATVMQAPSAPELVRRLLAPDVLERALDLGDPQHVLFAARQLAAARDLSLTELASIALRMRERAAALEDAAVAGELEGLARGIERTSARKRTTSLRRRNKRSAPSARTTYYEAFRDDVLANNQDGATDYVYMLTAADWARLEAEYRSLPDEATVDLIEILGCGPEDGLRILAALLRGSDPHRARAAAEAIAIMAGIHADAMTLSSSEAALLQRLVSPISPELASVLHRAVPDTALAGDETILAGE